MKNLYITVIIALYSISSFGQSGSAVVIGRADCSNLNNDKLRVSIFIKADDGPSDINLAEQNYRIEYNAQAISIPTIVADPNGLGYNNPVFSDNGNISFYSVPTLTGSIEDVTGSYPSIVSLNYELSGGDGIPLSSTEELFIATLEFNVVDPTADYEFNFHTLSTAVENFPPTFLGSKNNGVLHNLNDNTLFGGAVFFDEVDPGSDIEITVEASCGSNDGSIHFDWPDNDFYHDMYTSFNNGIDWIQNPGLNEATWTNLSAIILPFSVKIGENGCVQIMDDIIVDDLSINPTVSRGFTNCGENTGWVKFKWTNKVSPTIDLSIDGGQTFTTVNAQDEEYVFTDLAEGNYSTVLKWTEGKSCEVSGGTKKVKPKTPKSEDLTIDYNCNNSVTMYETGYDAPHKRFRYRVRVDGIWASWTNSPIVTNSEFTVELPADAEYIQYRVHARCENIWSSWSSVVLYKVPVCNFGRIAGGSESIDDIIDIYPNPSKDYCNVYLGGLQFETGSITLMNSNGQIVQSIQIDEFDFQTRIDFPDLESGVYLIQIQTDKNTPITKRISITP